jgi:hypothetical protein
VLDRCFVTFQQAVDLATIVADRRRSPEMAIETFHRT